MRIENVPPGGGLSPKVIETAPRRARKFFEKRAASGVEGAATESAGSPRRGPPDEKDARDIAAKLIEANAAQPKNGLLGVDPDAHANALAKSLVEQAQRAVEKLEGGSDSAISEQESAALEAVMHTRGRPALKVEGERIEALNEALHPGSGIWRVFLNANEERIVKATNSTGAVVVTDPTATWVQGTAWLVARDLVMTNRHVLFPPNGGVQLARRHGADPETARMRTGQDVTIDFAFDNGSPGRKRICKVIDVPYVSLDADPIDVALVRIEPLQDSVASAPLVVSGAAFDSDQLYIVGHPGRLETVPADVNAVFGSPDEHKRVSFGELMDDNSSFPNELIHDASTIGGYSGGCVLGFTSLEVVGLHFFGDPTSGNRAFKSTALRAHKVKSFLG